MSRAKVTKHQQRISDVKEELHAFKLASAGAMSTLVGKMQAFEKKVAVIEGRLEALCAMGEAGNGNSNTGD